MGVALLLFMVAVPEANFLRGQLGPTIDTEFYRQISIDQASQPARAFL